MIVFAFRALPIVCCVYHHQKLSPMNKPALYAIPLFTVTLLLLVVAAFYSTILDRSMRYDEAYTILHYTHDPAQALLFYNLPNNHLLHSFLVWISRNTLGLAPMAVRMPAFAAGMATLAMTYRITQRLASHKAGLIAVSLMGASMSLGDYMVNARGYTLTFLFSLLLFDLLFLQRRIRGMAIFAVCMGAMMTMPSMAVPIASNALWLIWKFKSNGREALYHSLLPMITGSVAGLLFYIPSVLTGTTSMLQLISGPSWADLLSSLWQLLFAGLAGVVLFVLAGIGGVFALRQRSPFMCWFGWQIAGILLLAFLQYVVTGTLFFARNYLYLLPFIAALAGMGLYTFKPAFPAPLAFLLLFIAIPDLLQLGQPNEIDRLRELVKTHTAETDVVLVGAGYAEPIIYHLVVDGYPDRLLLSVQKKRLLIIESDWENYRVIANLNGIAEAIVNNCAPVEDPSWRPFSLYSCPISPGNRPTDSNQGP